MKVIHLTKEYQCEDRLGQFITEADYDTIIDYDCDVYKPSSDLSANVESENNCLIKFRKGVFSPELLALGYEAFITAATKSENRGLAAGPKSEKQGTRDWVYELQLDLLELCASKTRSFDFEDRVRDLVEKCSGDLSKTEVSSRGKAWLKYATEEDGFVFLDWAKNILNLSTKDQQESANRILDRYISVSTYANPVNSGIAGFFDRYPRIPFCRETVWTNINKNLFEKGIPYVEAISELFRQHMPERWENQRKAIQTLDPNFIVGNSVFTTVTCNKNYKTAAHRDAGDLPNGFGNIVALSKHPVGWVGGMLVFPKYRVAVNLRPGDYLLFDPHEIHGNTEYITPDGMEEMDRLSLVLYARENMQNCEAKIIEDLRYKFVESRRLNEKHPNWRPRWNGITEGMWSSEEWKMYLLNNGLHDYVQEKFKPEETESLF